MGQPDIAIEDRRRRGEGRGRAREIDVIEKRTAKERVHVYVRAMLAHRYPPGRHLIRAEANEGLAANLDLCSRCSA